MAGPRISLEQWKALISVVESGGYAQASEQLHKSQSTLSYAIQKVERLLRVKLFELKGRKAQLTDAGHILYVRGKSLVEEAARLELAAESLSAGWEAEIRLAVEIVFPTWLLLKSLAAFGEEHPQTRIELYETVLEGNVEAMTEGRADISIGPTIPPGFVGEALMNVRFVLAAAPSHPLHQLGRPVVAADLKPHRHLIVRDTGSKRVRATNVIATQRWTVSHKATSIRAATMGLGFAWFPEDSIREELDSGQLKPVPMREGTERYATLYLIHAGGDLVGKGARRLGAIIREQIKALCPESGKPAATADGLP